MALCGAVLGKRQAWNVSVLQFSEGELYRVCFSPAEVPFPSLGGDICYLAWFSVF